MDKTSNQEIKLLNLIRETDQESKRLYENYVSRIQDAIREIDKRRKGLDLTLSGDDKATKKALEITLIKVEEVREKYLRLLERRKYLGIEEVFSIVKDWYDFVSLVSTIHLKSAEAILKKIQEDPPQFDKVILIKLEEIQRRFDEKLK